MEIGTVAVLSVGDASVVSEARRASRALATRSGFNESDAARLALVITELGTNILKHSGRGELILNRLVFENQSAGIAVLALDKGPGIGRVDASLEDGYSTAGSPGTGLGAVRRLASDFDIFSRPGGGTAVYAAVWPGGAAEQTHPHGFDPGCVSVPKSGEDANGDACVFDFDGSCMRCLLADGLGHGPLAAQAALAAVAAFREHAGRGPAEALERIHRVLRPTRGAAVASIEIDAAGRTVRFAGVGNITASITSPEGGSNMVSLNGTVGHEVRKIREFVYRWPAGSLMIAHSDGVSARWRLEDRPGLSTRAAILIAGVLYRDFGRDNDDATVLAVRDVGPGGLA